MEGSTESKLIAILRLWTDRAVSRSEPVGWADWGRGDGRRSPVDGRPVDRGRCRASAALRPGDDSAGAGWSIGADRLITNDQTMTIDSSSIYKYEYKWCLAPTPTWTDIQSESCEMIKLKCRRRFEYFPSALSESVAYLDVTVSLMDESGG